MSLAVLELAYTLHSSDGETCWRYLAVLETVYIADIHVNGVIWLLELAYSC